VTSIGNFLFEGLESLTSVYVEWPTPLKLDFPLLFYWGGDNNIILYVPKGTKALYEAAEGWKDFKDIIEYGEDGIVGITGIKEESVNPATIFNLSGQRVSHPRKGIYIQGGKKVLVK